MSKVIEIKEYDVANGPGIRTSVWFRGCPHACSGCFNEETWSREGAGEEFSQATIDKVLGIIATSPVQKDLSILGGEPLVAYNINDVIELCKQIKSSNPECSIWIWSGYLFEDLLNLKTFQELVQYFDVLVDGKFELDKKDLTLPYRGSSNQRVIDVKLSIKENQTILFDF